MIDLDDWDTDADGWDDWGLDAAHPVKEEPDCHTCDDSGIILRPVRRPSWRQRHLRLPWRRGWRQCPGCDPTRLDLTRARLYWRWHSFRGRLGWGTYDHEAPF